MIEKQCTCGATFYIMTKGSADSELCIQCAYKAQAARALRYERRRICACGSVYWIGNAPVVNSHLCQKCAYLAEKERKRIFGSGLLESTIALLTGRGGSRRRDSKPFRKKLWIEAASTGLLIHCCICGNELDHSDITLEHLTPLSRGGTYAWENLSLAHRRCNNNRGSR